MQHRLKSVAEELGFHGTIEKEVPGGSVDLVLQKGDYSVACEISFTTTIDHEVGNIIKCLKAGFERVAAICLDDSRLSKLETAVSGCLSPVQSSHVSYFVPEAFITHLQELAKTEAGTPPPSEVQLGKYRVKTSRVPMTDEERQRKESLMVKMVADTMKQPRKRKA